MRIARIASLRLRGLNPVLFKEVRQGTRSALFLAMFGVVLAGACLMSILGAGGAELADNYRYRHGAPADAYSMGYYIASGLAYCLIIAVCGAVPLLAFRSVTAERGENTFDLLAVSGLGGLRLVWGKYTSACLQMLLMISALAPFMVFAYLLGGIDLLGILLSIGWIVGMGLVMTMLAIWLGSLASRSWLIIILQLATAGISALICIGYIALFVDEPVLMDISRAAQDPDFWKFVGFLAVLAGALFAMLLTISANQFSFAAANRSTGPRITFAILLAGPMGFLLYLTRGVDFPPPIWATIAACGTSPLAWIAGLIAVTEPAGLSRRLQRRISANPILQFLYSLFLPGPGRGWLYMLLIVCPLAAGLPAMGAAWDNAQNPSGWFHSPGIEFMPLWLAAANIFLWGTARAAAGLFVRGPISTLGLRVRMVAWSAGIVLLPFIVIALGFGPEAMVDYLNHDFYLDHLWENPTNRALTNMTMFVLGGLGLVAAAKPIARDLAEQVRVARQNRIPAPNASAAAEVSGQ